MDILIDWCQLQSNICISKRTLCKTKQASELQFIVYQFLMVATNCLLIGISSLFLFFFYCLWELGFICSRDSIPVGNVIPTPWERLLIRLLLWSMGKRLRGGFVTLVRKILLVRIKLYICSYKILTLGAGAGFRGGFITVVGGSCLQIMTICICFIYTVIVFGIHVD